MTDQQFEGADAPKQSKREFLIQFIKFGIVGASNTLLSYGINVLTLYLLSLHHRFCQADYIFANTVAFILSVLWSFYWNNKMVFDMKTNSWRELLAALGKMYLSYAFTGIILSNALSYLWIDVLDIGRHIAPLVKSQRIAPLIKSQYIAPLINSAIGVPINFILNKYWAFKGK